jgi:cyclopropane-fatty-acyl-phospholipid synthase
MIEKSIIQAVFKHIRHGAFTVTYWDGSTASYGSGTPYFNLTVKSPAVIWAIMRHMTLGFGEAYMNGQVEVEGDLKNVGRLVSENRQTFNKLSVNLPTSLLHTNTRHRQKANIQHHYDLGNDFYKMWLDSSMTYSCAYFHSPQDSLELAQEQKLQHVLKKLQISEGHTVLDIGSGWGALCIEAAHRYGAKAHGITLSREQYEYSVAAARKAGLDKQVTFELLNYQDLSERRPQFDRIVSVGMFEHVGRSKQAQYFRSVKQMLKPGGISVLHSITNQVETASDRWTDKYIFPGGYIPAIRQVVSALPDYDYHLIDYENLRIHYALTLEEWLRRYESQKSEVIKKYDERFYRMWRFYLASSAAGFRYGELSLSQFVFTNGPNNDLPLTREHLYR